MASQPQLPDACSCSLSSTLAKKDSRSVNFWTKRASSSLPPKAAFCARVKVPITLTLLRAFLFRGMVKSWNSKIRFLFCWLTETKDPFFSFGSSKMVSRHLGKSKRDTVRIVLEWNLMEVLETILRWMREVIWWHFWMLHSAILSTFQDLCQN